MTLIERRACPRRSDTIRCVYPSGGRTWSACYHVFWQLPGRDFHRPATTGLPLSDYLMAHLQGRQLGARTIAARLPNSACSHLLLPVAIGTMTFLAPTSAPISRVVGEDWGLRFQGESRR